MESELNEEELLACSKQELVSKIKALKKINSALKSKLKHPEHGEKVLGKSRKLQRSFDFTRYKKRHVAFKVAYLGWDFQGLAAQENTSNTIEGHLFAALKKTCLVEDIKFSNYSRCGRTDKGVSAFGQVVALHVRSKCESGVGIIQDDSCCKDEGTSPGKEEEFPFIRMLNRTLPEEIRVLAWTPVPSDFSSRFSCRSRTYKYFFPAGHLDIEKMRVAAQKLVGEHDFRNFCKVDTGNNVTHFIRRILSFEIAPSELQGTSAYNMYEMTICGLAFLWHQVRCMASVLLLVGLHLEEPEIIDKLLNVTECTKRPQYNIASEIPLVLYHCDFDNIRWKMDQGEDDSCIAAIIKMWTNYAVRTTMLKRMLLDLGVGDEKDSDKEDANQLMNLTVSLLPGHRKRHRSLMERPVCEGLVRHLDKQALKRLRFHEMSAVTNQQLISEGKADGSANDMEE